MKIAIDAMGGDNSPEAIVQGAVQAARDFGLTVQLVGQPAAIEAELVKYQIAGLDLPIIAASEVITMDEHPAAAVKSKRDSSMAVATRLVKTGASDAVISAGNSGGMLATALFELGRIAGIRRPALSTLFPNESPHGQCLILDVGANVDAKPEYLLQFGLMGHLYALEVLGIPNPRVGLLSTGEEAEKGNQLVQEATRLFVQNSMLNFVGNVEGKDIPNNAADVIVCDGFVGNVYLKGAEGVASAMVRVLRQEIKKRPLAILGAMLMRGAFKGLQKRTDYREYGGAPLLGVNGIAFVAHGRSDAYAIRGAIRTARNAIEHNIVDAIVQGLGAYENSY